MGGSDSDSRLLERYCSDLRFWFATSKSVDACAQSFADDMILAERPPRLTLLLVSWMDRACEYVAE